MSETEIKGFIEKLKEHNYTVAEANRVIVNLQKVLKNKDYDMASLLSSVDAWLYFYKKEEGFTEREIIGMTKDYPALLLPVEDNPYLRVKETFKKYQYTDFEFQLAITKNDIWFQKKTIDIEQRLALFRMLKMKQAPILNSKAASVSLENICARTLYLSKKEDFCLNKHTLHYLFLPEAEFQKKVRVSTAKLVEAYKTKELVCKLKKKMARKVYVPTIKPFFVTSVDKFLDCHDYSVQQKKAIQRFYESFTPAHRKQLNLNLDYDFEMIQKRGLTENQVIDLTAKVPELLYHLIPLQWVDTIFQTFGFTNEQFLYQLQMPSVANLFRSADELAQRLFLFDYFALDPNLFLQCDIANGSLEQLYARYTYFKKQSISFSSLKEMRYLFDDFKKLPLPNGVTKDWLEQQYSLPSIFRNLSFVNADSIDQNRTRIRLAMMGYTDEVADMLLQNNLLSSFELKSLLDVIDQAGITNGTVSLLRKNQLWDLKKVRDNFLEKQTILRRYYTDDQVRNVCSHNRELFELGNERLENCLKFYNQVGLLEVPLSKFRSLHQALDTTYSRYHYFKEQGISITPENASLLYVTGKKFEERYGITDARLHQIYCERKFEQIWDRDRFTPYYASDYEAKQYLFEKHQYDPSELSHIYRPETLLYEMKPQELDRYLTLLDCLQIPNGEMPLSLYLNQELEKNYARYLYLRKDEQLELNSKTLYQMFVGEDLFEMMHGVTDQTLQKKYSVDQFFHKLNERKRNMKSAPSGKVLRFVKRTS